MKENFYSTNPELALVCGVLPNLPDVWGRDPCPCSGDDKGRYELLTNDEANRGYFVVVSYLHYFMPGSLKIYTDREVHSSSDFTAGLKEGLFTRRWLPSGESPYPGYCRAPGSSRCVPALCNCEQLTSIAKRIRHMQQMLDKENHSNNTDGT